MLISIDNIKRNAVFFIKTLLVVKVKLIISHPTKKVNRTAQIKAVPFILLRLFIKRRVESVEILAVGITNIYCSNAFLIYSENNFSNHSSGKTYSISSIIIEYALSSNDITVKGIIRLISSCRTPQTDQ
jgi:hypothetical protein